MGHETESESNDPPAESVMIDGVPYVPADEASGQDEEPSTEWLMEQYVEKHPMLIEAETVASDTLWVYANLTDGVPGTTNIGAGRTDAGELLSDQGYEIEIGCIEEVHDYDLGLELCFVEHSE